jgi:hypothetical protein
MDFLRVLKSWTSTETSTSSREVVSSEFQKKQFSGKHQKYMHSRLHSDWKPLGAATENEEDEQQGDGYTYGPQ